MRQSAAACAGIGRVLRACPHVIDNDLSPAPVRTPQSPPMNAQLLPPPRALFPRTRHALACRPQSRFHEAPLSLRASRLPHSRRHAHVTLSSTDRLCVTPCRLLMLRRHLPQPPPSLRSHTSIRLGSHPPLGLLAIPHASGTLALGDKTDSGGCIDDELGGVELAQHAVL